MVVGSTYQRLATPNPRTYIGSGKVSEIKTVSNGKEFLLTDTVGFIQKLPTMLIAAFRATLEEISESPLLVHVVDIRFVQFRADQDCFCGALSCRQKLGCKFRKLKESDASFQDLPNRRPVAGLLREAYHCNCIDVGIWMWNLQHKKY